ncbi:MAG: hypothetical protein WC796_01870 [Candidatus Pacearchaeota archaeon]|jgi:hypothetical protein
MIRKKCPNCSNKFSKKYEYCPFCGFNTNHLGEGLKNKEDDYGFLGKDDLKSFENEIGVKLPFGFKMLMKPLLKELNKQMTELDKELKKENPENSKETVKKINGLPISSFSVYISSGNGQPIKFSSNNLPQLNNSQQNPQQRQIKVGPGVQESLVLPVFEDDVFDKIKDLPKKEPETNVRRLSDKIVYELDVPGVKSTKQVNINKIEEGFDIKAFSKDKMFVKKLSLGLPLLKYYLKNQKLFLELGLR